MQQSRAAGRASLLKPIRHGQQANPRDESSLVTRAQDNILSESHGRSGIYLPKADSIV